MFTVKGEKKTNCFILKYAFRLIISENFLSVLSHEIHANTKSI